MPLRFVRVRLYFTYLILSVVHEEVTIHSLVAWDPPLPFYCCSTLYTSSIFDHKLSFVLVGVSLTKSLTTKTKISTRVYVYIYCILQSATTGYKRSYLTISSTTRLSINSKVPLSSVPFPWRTLFAPSVLKVSCTLNILRLPVVFAKVKNPVQFPELSMMSPYWSGKPGLVLRHTNYIHLPWEYNTHLKSAVGVRKDQLTAFFYIIEKI